MTPEHTIIETQVALLLPSPRAPSARLRASATRYGGAEGSGVGGDAWDDGFATRSTPHPCPPPYSLREWGEGTRRFCGTTVD
jgi:hypothetical protein